MNNLKFWQQTQLKPYAVGSFTLFLIYFLVNCLHSYAFNPPEIAEIRTVDGPRLRVRLGGSDSISKAAEIGTRLRQFRDTLLVPGNNDSLAGMALFNGRGRLVNETNQTLFMAGPDDTPTEYSLSCQILVGSATVGFSEGQPPCERGVRVATYRNPLGQLPDSKYSDTSQALKSLLNAQASVDQFQYCSTVSASGKGWGVAYSQNPSDDPCQQAREKCLQASSEEECYAVSFGEWSVDDPELVASVQCEGKLPFTRKGDGRKIFDDLLPFMEKMGNILGSSGCVFHVYNPEQILVSPASNDSTLIQVYDSGDGDLAIDVLVGDARIVSAQRPQGLTVSKGYGYRQEKNGLTLLDCPERFKSESIQEFLKPANWSQSNDPSVNQGIINQLEGYRENFCESEGSSEDPSNNRPRIIIPIPIPGSGGHRDGHRNY
ncbi:MAG: hypothetical protein AB4426_17415 [Xenococcaceae cyanobacterium]